MRTTSPDSQRITARPRLGTLRVADLQVWRERRSWQLAAEHLNGQGLPACVPCELVAYLKRRGLSVWCRERAA